MGSGPRSRPELRRRRIRLDPERSDAGVRAGVEVVQVVRVATSERITGGHGHVHHDFVNLDRRPRIVKRKARAPT